MTTYVIAQIDGDDLPVGHSLTDFYADLDDALEVCSWAAEAAEPGDPTPRVYELREVRGG